MEKTPPKKPARIAPGESEFQLLSLMKPYSKVEGSFKGSIGFYEGLGFYTGLWSTILKYFFLKGTLMK